MTYRRASWEDAAAEAEILTMQAFLSGKPRVYTAFPYDRYHGNGQIATILEWDWGVAEYVPYEDQPELGLGFMGFVWKEQGK